MEPDIKDRRVKLSSIARLLSGYNSLGSFPAQGIEEALRRRRARPFLCQASARTKRENKPANKSHPALPPIIKKNQIGT